MPHGTEIGLGAGDIVFDGEPASCPHINNIGAFHMGRKAGGDGGAVPHLGELDPHLTQCGLDRGLPLYQVAP